MNLIEKIEKLLVDEVVTGDVEQNTTKGNVDLINKDDTHNCKDGEEWCPMEKKCVPIGDGKGQGKGEGKGHGNGPLKKKTNESVVSGSVIGSGQSRTIGKRDGEIEVLTRKPRPLKFNKLLGAYLPGYEEK